MSQGKKEMKSLGFFGIYKESLNIISSNTKLFAQITFCIILPLSVIATFGTPLSAFLFPDIIIHQTGTAAAAYSYQNLYGHVLSWRFGVFLIYQLAFLVLSYALSLLSFSSVVYAVTCIYTEHAITFKNAIGAFQKIWKKLLLTRLAELAAIAGFTLLTGLLLIVPVWAFTSSGRYQTFGAVAIFIISLVYFVGLVYVSFVWILSGMVSVLENDFGFKALSKSRSLIKGKRRLAGRVIIPISLCNLAISWLLQNFVLHGSLNGPAGIVLRTCSGIVGLLFLVGVLLFSLVAQAVLYLVCKADKGESIGKSSVMAHLDMYVDGYTPLVKGKGEEI